MTKKTITGLLLALTIISIPAHAETKGQFGASGAIHFDNQSFMAQGRYIKHISPNTSIAPAVAFDFDLEEVVIDIDLQVVESSFKSAVSLLFFVNRSRHHFSSTNQSSP